MPLEQVILLITCTNNAPGHPVLAGHVTIYPYKGEPPLREVIQRDIEGLKNMVYQLQPKPCRVQNQPIFYHWVMVNKPSELRHKV